MGKHPSVAAALKAVACRGALVALMRIQWPCMGIKSLQGALAVAVEGTNQTAEGCYYQFQAATSTLALETQTLRNFGRVVLSPGNLLSLSFPGVPCPAHGADAITGASLFVLSSLHASSSTSLEVAVGGISVSTNSSAGNVSTSIGSMQVQAGAAAGISRNASELESNISDDAWGVTDITQETGGNTVWEACRYYEVGNIEEELRNVLSNSTMCQGNTLLDIELLVRHRSGSAGFIEGNNATYANNAVLQIRSDCNTYASRQGELPSYFPTPWDLYATGESYYGFGEFSSSATSWSTGTDEKNVSERNVSEGTSVAWPESREHRILIRNGQRHSSCGGVYLNACQLGPYQASDVGDGSCQQHLNTDGCHYDGGDCCSVSCAMASTLDTPYTCQGPDLDRYTCRDPMYVDDVVFSGTAAYPSLAISKFHPRGYMSVAIVAVVSLGVVTIDFGGAWWY